LARASGCGPECHGFEPRYPLHIFGPASVGPLFLSKKRCYSDFIMKKDILTYYDLAKIKAGENKEKLVSLSKRAPKIVCQYEKKDMLAYVGDEIYVRETVAKMLIQVSENLKTKNSDYSLKVVYGYRHPEIQQDYFDKRKQEIKSQEPGLTDEELYAKVHWFVAAPNVAGHTVGGAVDITTISSQVDLDMGTTIADFSDEEKIQTFYKNISDEQRQNRALLHDLMIEVGFAPFYGEWWHFSYGDKEWAAFYKQQQSLYSLIDFNLPAGKAGK
jgi:zinc D-Ala-D-Ala dipeptidase